MKLQLWKRRQRRTLARGSGYLVGIFATALFWSWLSGRRRTQRIPRRTPVTADERTMRRIAEAQAGGMSSQEGRARYERGEHPGGLHAKAVRVPLDAESYEDYEDEEPSDRLEIHHGRRRVGMPALRR